MSVAKIKSGGGAVTATSTDNNGGAMKAGQPTTLGVGMARVDMGFKTNDIGQHINTGNTVGIAKAVSAGALASMTAGAYIGLAGLTRTTIGGVANTALFTPGTSVNSRRSINYVEDYRTTFLSTWRWQSALAGSKESTLVVTKTYSTTNVDNATDNAATPSRSVPGEFILKGGALVPLQKDYPAKTDG